MVARQLAAVTHFPRQFLARQTGTGEQCSPLQEFFDSLSFPQGEKPYKPKADSPLSGLSVYIYSTSIPQAPSARVKDFGFLYKLPVIPRLYAAWALALLSSTKIDSS